MNDIVQSLNTALEGRYRVLRQLGEGGMATVYLADDVKHGRRVAVKVLKPELAAVVGAERFLVEIKTTANLQHPNILPLFDSGTAGSFLFYVMPFVEGETLRDRLDRERQLPIEDAVHIISDVAAALDYAHRNGVVHRDIKPANILLREGKPLVADFGIALAIGAAGDGRMTETGLSLGTPHYMSPEQALGERGVGAPSDIYAIGCVLYEMLVGEPPYTGGSATAIVGKIIAGELSAPTKQRPNIPPNINDAIRKALEKLPADRFRSAQDFAKALRDPAFRHGIVAPPSQATATAWPWKIAAIALGALALFLGAGLAMTFRRPVPAGMVARFEAPFRDGQGPLEQRSSTFAISADGRFIAYKGSDQQQLGGSQIWIRRWNELDAHPVPGTDAAASLSLSPDGQQIAMTQGGLIKVISTAGGAARSLAQGYAGFWALDGYIYYTTLGRDLRRVSAGGGDSAVVRPASTPPDDNIAVHDVLPGETHALVSITRPGEPTVIAVVDVSDGKTTVIGPGSWPRYAPTGHLLWIAADGVLNAAPFNPRNLRAGSPTPLVTDVVGYAFSPTGTLAYTASESGDSIPTNLVFVQKDGTRANRVEFNGTAWYPRFSRDGRRVAVGIGVDLTPGGRADLWTYEVTRGALTRVTFGGNNKFVPTWTPDGSRLTHSDGTANENRLLSTSADGTGEATTLLDVSERKFPTSWSPDGKFLAYYLGPQGTPTNSRDIWLLEATSEGMKPRPFVQTPFMERGAIFSPDGRWLAYVSDKAGKNGVYARPFPGPGNEETISVAGGSEPVWAPSGREIYYRHDDSLMVVSVDTRGTTLTVGAPRRLFRDPFMRDVGGSAGGVANYDIAPSGDRFVMIESPTAASGGAHVKMTVVLNWFDELRAGTAAR